MIILPQDSGGRAVDSFWEDFTQHVKTRPDRLTVDCSNLEQVTSSHIKIIWQARSECLDAKVGFELVHPTEGLKRILRVLDLYEIYFPDAPDQVASEVMIARAKQKSGASLELELLAQPESVNEALGRFRAFITDSGVPQGDGFELATVFYEVATNIRLHSGADEKELIIVTITLHSDKCIMQFTDGGCAFDPTSHPAVLEPKSAIQVKQTRGYGLAMVARMTDKMSYTRKAGKYNVLVLEKNWGRK